MIYKSSRLCSRSRALLASITGRSGSVFSDRSFHAARAGKQDQYITVTHGLNITDWNDDNIDVGIMGKTSPNGELLRSFILKANGIARALARS